MADTETKDVEGEHKSVKDTYISLNTLKPPYFLTQGFKSNKNNRIIYSILSVTLDNIHSG